MSSRFEGLSPTLGSLLSVHSLLQILYLPLSLPLPHSCFLSLSQKWINIKKKIKKKKRKHLGAQAKGSLHWLNLRTLSARGMHSSFRKRRKPPLCPAIVISGCRQQWLLGTRLVILADAQVFGTQLHAVYFERAPSFCLEQVLDHIAHAPTIYSSEWRPHHQ